MKTVRELIEALQGMNPDAIALVDGYEGGLKPITLIEAKPVALDVNKGSSYYGPHEEVIFEGEYEEYQQVSAVHIH